MAWGNDQQLRLNAQIKDASASFTATAASFALVTRNDLDAPLLHSNASDNATVVPDAVIYLDMAMLTAFWMMMKMVVLGSSGGTKEDTTAGHASGGEGDDDGDDVDDDHETVDPLTIAIQWTNLKAMDALVDSIWQGNLFCKTILYAQQKNKAACFYNFTSNNFWLSGIVPAQ